MPTSSYSRLTFLIAASVLLGRSGAASAQDEPARPLWEIGVGALATSQQAYPGSDHQVRRGLALPYLVYRGRYLRADDEGIGVRPISTPRFEFDIGASGSFGARASDVEARRGMPDLGTRIELGPRLKWHLGGSAESGRWRLDLPLRGVFDLSNDFAYRGAVFQPALVWQKRGGAGWAYGASVSALIGDRRLARTFYEVAPAYATLDRPAYRAEAGLLGWRLSASASRSLSRDWRLFGFARIDSVAGAANRASPLVRQTTGATAGIGVSYTWMRSAASAP